MGLVFGFRSLSICIKQLRANYIMIRITNIKLLLDHPEESLLEAIATSLSVDISEIRSFKVFKRSYDARKREVIFLIYSIDVDVNNEAQLLLRHENNTNIRSSPDTSYKYVASAPISYFQRPVIIGAGPCGLMAGLILAQMGFKPIILERGTGATANLFYSRISHSG